MSVVFARRTSRKQSSAGFDEKDLQAQEFGRSYVLKLLLQQGMLAPASKIPEEREFVVDSGASTHMTSKKDLSSEEMGAVKRSTTPTVYSSFDW